MTRETNVKTLPRTASVAGGETKRRKPARLRACLNLFRPGWNGWNERDYSWSFHAKLFVSILNFQATEQPTRTENSPTDFCGGTAQLDPKTGRGAVT